MSERNENVVPLGKSRIRAVRMEIVESDAAGVPQMLVPAMVDDHDKVVAHPIVADWPGRLSPSTLKLHQHFCELVFAWNMNPFRRDPGTAAVDDYAQTLGKSRFSFTSKESLDDWLEYYMLDDFIVQRIEAPRSDAFHFIELTNKFLPSEIEQFMATYNDAMGMLAHIETERHRALIYDGNKVGHAFIDHYAARETHELMRIKQARILLGASGYERTK